MPWRQLGRHHQPSALHHRGRPVRAGGGGRPGLLQGADLNAIRVHLVHPAANAREPAPLPRDDHRASRRAPLGGAAGPPPTHATPVAAVLQAATGARRPSARRAARPSSTSPRGSGSATWRRKASRREPTSSRSGFRDGRILEAAFVLDASAGGGSGASAAAAGVALVVGKAGAGRAAIGRRRRPAPRPCRRWPVTRRMPAAGGGGAAFALARSPAQRRRRPRRRPQPGSMPVLTPPGASRAWKRLARTSRCAACSCAGSPSASPEQQHGVRRHPATAGRARLRRAPCRRRRRARRRLGALSRTRPTRAQRAQRTDERAARARVRRSPRSYPRSWPELAW